MERRILKDFQIGLVEGIVNDVLVKSHEPKDVFSQIAKAIGSRASAKSTNWNEIVRKNTVVRDPIGSTQASIHRVHRRSLRRHIMDSANKGLEMNTEKLLEYNPLLSEVSAGTRVAYVKFMSKKMKKEDHLDSVILQDEEDKRKKGLERGDSLNKEQFGALVKKASIIRRKSEEAMEVAAASAEEEANSKDLDIERPDIKDFRSRTPIPEEPNEEVALSPDLKTGEMSKRSSVADCQSPVNASPKKSPSPSPKPSTPIPTSTIEEPENASTSKDLLQVTSRSESRGSARDARVPSPAPSITITSSKGKSAVSGRNMEGWI